MVPAVFAAAAGVHDVTEMRRAVIEFHATAQRLDHFRRSLPKDAAGIFAVHLVGGVHHGVGQLTVGGQQQQAGGVNVQAAYRDPAAFAQAGQAVENGGRPSGSEREVTSPTGLL